MDDVPGLGLGEPGLVALGHGFGLERVEWFLEQLPYCYSGTAATLMVRKFCWEPFLGVLRLLDPTDYPIARNRDGDA